MRGNIFVKGTVAVAVALPLGAAAALLLLDSTSRAPFGGRCAERTSILSKEPKTGSLLEPEPLSLKDESGPAEGVAALPSSATCDDPGDDVAALVAALRDARANGLEETAAALEERLTGVIAQDPAGALRVLLDLARGSSDEEAVEGIFELLAAQPALSEQPDAAHVLADLAAKGDETWRRSAALRALGELPGETAARSAEIAALGRNDAAPDVREAAAAALTELAERSPGEVAASASKAAVQSLVNEPDPSVRAALLGAIRDTRDPAAANALLVAVANEPEAMVREAAAEALGDVALAHRGRAIETLAERFTKESEDDVRRTILASIVRAARSNAVATLESLRATAGALAVDVDDYLVALRAGEDDPAKLALLKSAREASREPSSAAAPRAD